MKLFDFLNELGELNDIGNQPECQKQVAELQALPVIDVIKEYWPIVRKALVLVKFLTNAATDKKIDTFITFMDITLGVLPLKK